APPRPGRDRRPQREDPHLQLPAGPAHRPPHRGDLAQPAGPDGGRHRGHRRRLPDLLPGRAAQGRVGPPPARGMSEQPWTVRRVLGWTTQHFEKLGVDSPRLTAELLLTHVLQTSRVRLYTDLDRPLEVSELAAYRGLIARRASGEPTSYLTGVREFYGRPFAVDARVLVPRPETELLVEAVLQAVPRDAP